MTVEFSCPQSNCGKTLRGPDELAGKQVKCPGCGSPIRVPPRAPAQAAPKARVVSKAPAPDPLVGKSLAHFQVTAKLGQGGMGAVYKARNTKLNRTVALKVLPEAVKARDPSFSQRFVREAQLAAQLDHSNIVTVYSVNSEAGHDFIEMQYVEGRTLRQMMDEGTLDVNGVTRIIAEAAKGLGAAHRKGIMHRDVKPENIMIDTGGQVMVADFGLAKLEESSTGLTLSGQIMGTPLYMSPEQAQGKALDFRSDIYSLGATFYHALVGRPPFAADSIHGLIYQHVHEPAPLLHAENPNVPADTSAVVQRMMAKDPNGRHTSYEELVSDLQALLGQGELSQVTTAKSVGVEAPVAGEKKKSKTGPVAALAVIALLVAAGLGIYFVKTKQAPAPKPAAPSAPPSTETPPAPSPDEGAAPSAVKRTAHEIAPLKEKPATGDATPAVSRRGQLPFEKDSSGKALPRKDEAETPLALTASERTVLDKRPPMAEPTSLLGTRGKLLLEDGFSEKSPLWVEKDCTWTLVRDALAIRGSETHCPKLLRQIPPVRNVMMQLRMLAPTTANWLVVHFGKPQHRPDLVFRFFAVRQKALIQLADPKPEKCVNLAEMVLPYKKPRWCTVQVEILGRKLAMTVDGRTIEAEGPEVTESLKELVQIDMGSRSSGLLAVDDVRIWELLPKGGAPAVAEAPTPGIDLAAYGADIRQANQRIDKGEYASARGRANLLEAKYPNLIKMKLRNLERIEALRRKCFERVNAGKIKLAMGDISRRYAFAGPIRKVDDKGLTAKITKTWDSLDRAELIRFYEASMDSKNAADLVALAAFVMEGTPGDKRLEASLDVLGRAKGQGADVQALEAYVHRLQQVVKKPDTASKATEAPAAKPAVAEVPPGKPVEPAPKIDNKPRDIPYVTKAATGDKIPHPLSRATHREKSRRKRVEVPDGMVYVPAGKSVMGAPDGSVYSGFVQKEVDLDAFYIDKYEVTNAQYHEFVKATKHLAPGHWGEHGNTFAKGKDACAVASVTWNDAKAYADWCGKRLPTEAEWEKAASWDERRRKKRVWPWGDDRDYSRISCCRQWGCPCNGDFGEHLKWWKRWYGSPMGKKIRSIGGPVAEVGKARGDVSPYGCCDMGGNVREWVADWFHHDYYRTGPKKNPTGPTREQARSAQYAGKPVPGQRVIRGGWWDNHLCEHPAFRSPMQQNGATVLSGFRCALSASDLETWKASAKRTEEPRESGKTDADAPTRRTAKAEQKTPPATIDKALIVVCQDGSGDFKTIQEAVDAAKDGATIEIGDNKVYSQHTIRGEKKKGITLRGKRGVGKPALRWLRRDEDEPTDVRKAAALMVVGENWTIERIRFENTAAHHKILPLLGHRSGNSALRNCSFSGMFENRLMGLARCTVENCIFDRCFAALHFSPASTSCRVMLTNSVVCHCWTGLVVADSMAETKIAMTGNVFAGIETEVLRLASFKSKATPQPATVASDHNCFSHVGAIRACPKERPGAPPPLRSLKEWQKAMGQDRHSVEGDPLFVDAARGNFRFQKTSPCRGAGPEQDGKKTDMGIRWREFYGK